MVRLQFGSCAKGHIILFLFLAAAMISISTCPARADDTPNSIQQYQKRLQELTGKCHEDLLCLQQNAAQLDPGALFGLSIQLLKSDPNTALDMFVLGQIRMRYDFQRCSDQSAGGGAMFLFSQIAGEVVQYARRHKMQHLAAMKRVQQRSDLFPDGPPAFGCGGGASAVKPASGWWGIAATLRQQFDQEIDKLNKEYAANPPPDYEPPNFATAVPAALLSASRPEKIAAVGAEARQAALAAAAETPSPEVLLAIAEAQLDAADIAGARDTLAAAQDVMTKSPKAYPLQREQLAALWARAGEAEKALNIAEGLPDPKQRVRALGRLGVSLAKAGSIDTTRKLIERIRQSAAPPDPRPLTDADMALQDISIALADAGDFGDAVREAQYLPKIISEPMLAKIAAKRCAAHDGGAPETLHLATASADGATGAYATELLYALASCGETDRALQAAERASSATLEHVADQLMRQDLHAEAQVIDQLIAERYPTANDLARVAERQAARGDLAGARANALRGYEMMRADVTAARDQTNPRYTPFDALQPLGTVISAQLKIRAYDDAIATAQLHDLRNAHENLVRILQAAAKNHDASAVRQILPRVLQSLETLDLPTEVALVNMAKMLGRAGYAAEARDLIDRAAQLKNAHCQRAPCINVAEADVAIGDIDAARAILQRLAAPRAQDGARVLLVRELIDPDGPSGILRPPNLPMPPPPRDASAVFPIAAEMAWQIQDPGTRANAMLTLLRSFRLQAG